MPHKRKAERVAERKEREQRRHVERQRLQWADLDFAEWPEWLRNSVAITDGSTTADSTDRPSGGDAEPAAGGGSSTGDGTGTSSTSAYGGSGASASK